MGPKSGTSRDILRQSLTFGQNWLPLWAKPSHQTLGCYLRSIYSLNRFYRHFYRRLIEFWSNISGDTLIPVLCPTVWKRVWNKCLEYCPKLTVFVSFWQFLQQFGKQFPIFSQNYFTMVIQFAFEQRTM